MARLGPTHIFGNLYVDSNISGNIDALNIVRGTINNDRLNKASTSQQGIVKLNSSLTSTSTTEAATASVIKTLNDTKFNKTGGTINGSIDADGYVRARNGNGIHFEGARSTCRVLLGCSDTIGDVLFGGNNTSSSGFSYYLRLSDTKLQYHNSSGTKDIFHTGNVPSWAQISGKPSTFAPIIGSASNQAAAGNHNHNSSYLGINAKAKDSSLLNGATSSIVKDANTIVQRDRNGDIESRLFMSTFPTEARCTGAIAFRANTSSDNYIRFCSDTTVIRNWIGAAPTNHSHGWNDIGGKPSTFAPIIGSASNQAAAGNHTHDDRYYTESEINTKFNSTHESLGSGILRVHDTRGANRPPSYYNARYSRFDFVEAAQLGCGGDLWSAMLTLCPWSEFSTSHRQQQLVFRGASGLAFRYATSQSGWSGWNTIFSSINKPSWDDITGKPSTYAPSGHSHSDASWGRLTLSNWLYCSGNNGVYFDSYGGGVHMTDGTWVRIYGAKSLRCESVISSKKIEVAGAESTFTDGTYRDPWYGVSCAAKFAGHVGVSDDFRTGGHIYIGQQGTTLQSCIYSKKRTYAGSNKNFLMIQVMDPTNGNWEDAMGLTTEGGNEIGFSAPIYPSDVGAYTIGGVNYRWRTLFIQNNPNVSSDYTIKNNIKYINGGLFKVKKSYPKLKETIPNIENGDCREFIRNINFATYFYNNYEIVKEYGVDDNNRKSVIGTERKIIDSSRVDFTIGFIAQDLLDNNVGQSILVENDNGELSYNTGSYTSAIGKALQEEIIYRDTEISELRNEINIIKKKLLDLIDKKS